VTKDSEQGEKSRSQIKREFLELKELGIQLAGLTPGQLQALPLSEKLCAALLAAKGMKRTALKRQYGHISSLMVNEDVAAIRAALTGVLQPHAQQVVAEKEAEHWREALLTDDDGQLTAFVERYPDCDRTHLRQLVRNAQKERELEKPPKSTRQLFRYIRQLAQQQD
jgi:ribosome-associated protein